MSRSTACGLVVLGWLLCATGARAEPFTIDLHVRAGQAAQTAHAESLGLGVKAKVRPVLEVKAGEQITVTWAMSNGDAKVHYTDVLVHFVAVKEEKAGQQAVPKLDRDVNAETALTMDFKPRDRAAGELTLTLPAAGAYLLRLETIGAAASGGGQEYFAALDVVAH